MASVRAPARPARCASSDEIVLREAATEYFQQNCRIGVSQPRPADVRGASRTVGLDRFMWGSDYPHDEGTQPFTREHLRQVVRRPPSRRDAADRSAATPPSSTASTSTALAPERRDSSARPSPRSPSRSPSCPRAPTRRCCVRREISRRRAPTCACGSSPRTISSTLPDDDQNYNESRYYNFFDPRPSYGRSVAGCGWGNRPNEGYAEMTVCLYLPDGRVGVHTTSGRRSTATRRTTPAACASRWSSPTRSTTSPTTARCACWRSPRRWRTRSRVQRATRTSSAPSTST